MGFAEPELGERILGGICRRRGARRRLRRLRKGEYMVWLRGAHRALRLECTDLGRHRAAVEDAGTIKCGVEERDPPRVQAGQVETVEESGDLQVRWRAGGLEHHLARQIVRLVDRRDA